MDILSLTATQLAKKIKSKEVTVEEVLTTVFKQIEDQEDALHCYVRIEKEKAFARGKEIQERINAGQEVGIFAGVPIAVKDNICVAGITTTCSSKILENFVPGYHASVIPLLENEDAIIIGKTNMDEFAMGSTTETSAFGVTKNPWNQECVPGGSSGGSAAAVAAKECFMALGSDTGGSIRQPASYCGVVGMKPTYGTVSRYGLIAYASSLDQIGPITKDVTDCAALLEIISKYDEKDSTSFKRDDCNFTTALVADVKGTEDASRGSSPSADRNEISLETDEELNRELNEINSFGNSSHLFLQAISSMQLT